MHCIICTYMSLLTVCLLSNLLCLLELKLGKHHFSVLNSSDIPFQLYDRWMTYVLNNKAGQDDLQKHINMINIEEIFEFFTIRCRQQADVQTNIRPNLSRPTYFFTSKNMPNAELVQTI
jgi:hypothetical protein